MHELKVEKGPDVRTTVRGNDIFSLTTIVSLLRHRHDDKSMRKLTAFAACALLLVGEARAGELPVGPVLFRLGAQQATVMTEVRANFRVISVSGKPDMFFLADRDSPNSKVIGGIAFQGGRLAWVQRNWGSFDGAARGDEVAKALYSAIDSATVATGSDATITTKVDRVPGTEFRATYFQFPGRKVALLLTDGSDKQVTVDESISLAP